MNMNWETVEKCIFCGSKNFNHYLNKNDVRYYICECGMIFQNPHLDADSLEIYYSSGKYRTPKATFFDPNVDKRMDGKERARQRRVAEYVLPGTHLDVGCSRGYLLQITSKKGCTILGVEPTPKYVLPDIPFVTSLDDVNEKFDTVTCIHVLEHVLNPIEFADKLIARVGKRLILEVPSCGFYIHHIYIFNKDTILKMFDKLVLKTYMDIGSNFFIFEKDY